MSHHHHGPGCSCGCHGHGADSAAALAEGALVLSHIWPHPGETADPDALEAWVACGLTTLGELLADEGMVLGHLKALIRCDSGEGIALSVTRTDTVDRTPAPCWPPAAPIDGWILTVNVLSLIRHDGVDETMLEQLFGTFG